MYIFILFLKIIHYIYIYIYKFFLPVFWVAMVDPIDDPLIDDQIDHILSIKDQIADPID